MLVTTMKDSKTSKHVSTLYQLPLLKFHPSYTKDDLVTGLNQSKVIIVEGVKFLAWERHFVFFEASIQAVGHKGPFSLRYNSQ